MPQLFSSSPSRRHLLHLAAASAAMALPPLARAQSTPDTLKLLCGFSAGGGADAITRWVGDKLNGVLARTTIVENRPGAGGRLAVDALRSAAPDGHTILLTPSSVVAMYPYVYTKLGYDPVRDLVPVSQVCDFVHALAVGPAVPASVKTLQDFAAWCAANPKAANCGNSGDGSMPHFLTILLSRALKIQIEPVPYKGAAPAVNDLLGGQLTALIAPEGSFTPYMADGRLRLLGVSGEKRSQFFPAVRTFAEQGAAGVIAGEWFGMFMPARTPPAVVARAAQAIAAAVRQPDMTEKFAKFGMVNVGSSPEELQRRLQADLQFWGPVVKSSGFTPLSS